MKKNVFTILLSLLVILMMWSFAPKTKKADILTVKTTSPKIRNIYDYITVNGRVKEGNKQNIYTDEFAKVNKVFIKVGDSVSEGTVLAELSPLIQANSTIQCSDMDVDEILSIFAENGFELNSIKDTIKIESIDNKTVQIKSNMSGIITDLNIREGDVANPLNKIISVSDLNDIYIELLIPEEYSSKITMGDKVTLTSDSAGEKIYTGKISNIYPVAKYVPSITGEGKTYMRADVDMKNGNLVFKPGFTVEAQIAANKIKNALTIPYECILQDETNNEYVYCIENETAKKRYITSGYELEGFVQIKSGLSEKDKIIINPPQNDIESYSLIQTE